LSATSVTNDSHTYHVFNSGTAQLLVDERIQVLV
ncbi:MAG: hypothetical protein JWQ11_1581, partial [Rhizobacter sp.]|nr:hypothetical protein [Rhizobacter sp.]